MKYDHRVKVDGKWFDAGVEVKTTPDNGSNEPPKTVEPPTTPDNTDNGSNEPPKGDENGDNANAETSNDENKPMFTRTEIQQMNKEQLIEVATSLGFEVNEENKVQELKQLILGKLGI